MRVVIVLALALAGCAADNGQTTTPVAGGQETSVEVGCAACIYSMDGVTSCKLAAKIDDEPMLVEGVDFDAHSQGLCGAAKEAKLVGKVEGDHFAATKIELVDEGGW